MATHDRVIPEPDPGRESSRVAGGADSPPDPVGPTACKLVDLVTSPTGNITWKCACGGYGFAQDQDTALDRYNRHAIEKAAQSLEAQ